MKRMRGLTLVACTLLLCVGCGGGGKKKVTAEMEMKVKNDVEQLRYLDQVRDKLVEVRTWEMENKDRILELMGFVEKRKVGKQSDQKVLVPVEPITDIRSIAKPATLSEADHAKLLGAFEAYYASMNAYTSQAIELSKYITESTYRKDNFKHGRELVANLQESVMQYRTNGLNTWDVLEAIQTQVSDQMIQDTPLGAPYKVVTLDVSNFKRVVDLIINYRDGEGELKVAMDDFNKLLESVYANRHVGEDVLKKAGKKQLFDVTYAELSKGLKVLKDLIMQLNYEGTDPKTVDTQLLLERYTSIHTAYKNFINE